MNITPPLSDRCMWDLWFSATSLFTTMAADELGIFDLIEEGRTDAASIAEGAGLGHRAAAAILHGVQSLGFVELSYGAWRNTLQGKAFLTKESPWYWGGLFEFLRKIPYDYHTTLKSLKEDRSAFYEEGQDIWTTHQADDQMVATFTRFMHSHAAVSAYHLAQKPIFSETKRLLDVGGGSGAYSIAFALQHEQSHAAVMDLPQVCKLTDSYIERLGATGRVSTIGLDMFQQDWPSGFDAVFLSDIFHDWPEDINQLLAGKAFDILPSEGRIFLHEVLLEPGDKRKTPAFYNVAMANTTAGKQYSAQELAGILEHAGFTAVEVEPANAYYSLISARKP